MNASWLKGEVKERRGNAISIQVLFGMKNSEVLFGPPISVMEMVRDGTPLARTEVDETCEFLEAMQGNLILKIQNQNNNQSLG